VDAGVGGVGGVERAGFMMDGWVDGWAGWMMLMILMMSVDSQQSAQAHAGRVGRHR
jgi:hypothetical protein